METARTFSNDCVTEMGNPEILPYLGTAQAVEDLEAFRQAMGDEKILAVRRKLRHAICPDLCRRASRTSGGIGSGRHGGFDSFRSGFLQGTGAGFQRRFGS